MIRSRSLTFQLNLWYGVVVVVILVVAGVITDLTTTFLTRQRQVQLIHQVETEVRRTYRQSGALAAAQVTVAGARTEVSEQGRALSRSPAGTGGLPVLDTVVELDDGVWLRISVPDDVIHATRNEGRLGLLLGGLLALVLALSGGVWVTRRALLPIDQLIETTRGVIAAGDQGIRVPRPGGGDQIDELVGLFNELLDRNGQLIETMRQSLDNVGHDLRTPLTRIRAAAELGITGGRVQEALGICIEEADDARQLLTALLDLTTAQAGIMTLSLEDVSLREVATKSLALYQHVADDMGVQLVLEAEQDGQVRADRMRLQQALANVLDNALKFSASGGRVEISIQVNGAFSGIRVTDQGCGIAESDLPHVFQRLYRADTSRSTQGAGLGLSLVKAIVEAHHGHVELQSSVGAGTTLTLWLPTVD